MSFHFHQNRKLYFEHQQQNTRVYVMPFIEEAFALKPGMRVMEIGCGEGGVLKAFLDKGFTGLGVELSESKFELASEFLKEEIVEGKVRLINKNIYDVTFEQEFGGAFDLIILKDVIEHIHDQASLMQQMQRFLKPDGHIYFGFPPWQMPFGGHQQICRGKAASLLPYYHLLPMPLYKGMLRLLGEKEDVIEDLVEIKETGISIERFERISRETGYHMANKRLYLINPIYEYKFKLKPRIQWAWLGALPWLRNFFTTCGYYLLKVEKK